MRDKKKYVVVGCALLSGVAMLTTKAMRKKKRSDNTAKAGDENRTLSLAFEVVELREALLRSYATGLKLREDNDSLRSVLLGYVSEDAPVLLALGDAVQTDPYVDSVVERESIFDGHLTCDEICTQTDKCVGLGCPLYIQRSKILINLYKTKEA